MGEIKSTLELIMEKTRDMVPSEEEKQAFRTREMEAEVRGLVQKYLDSMLDTEKIREELDSFEGDSRDPARRCLVRECAGRLDPEEVPGPLLDLMEQAAGVDPPPFLSCLGKYRERMDREAAEAGKRLAERIRRKGLSGDAVRPNIRSDRNWLEFLEEQRTSLREEAVGLAEASG